MLKFLGHWIVLAMPAVAVTPRALLGETIDHEDGKDLEAFTPGDYVGLAASSRRLAAAYVLPGEETVVSVVNLGAEACSIAGVSSTRNRSATRVAPGLRRR